MNIYPLSNLRSIFSLLLAAYVSGSAATFFVFFFAVVTSLRASSCMYVFVLLLERDQGHLLGSVADFRCFAAGLLL